jgi:ketosteroid isomerase-like protein
VESSVSDSILGVTERLYAALDADDIEGFLALCSDDVAVTYPAAGVLPYGGRWEGRDGVVRFLDTHDAAEEILEFEPGPMFASGDTVFVEGTFRGRAKPNGREWSTRFVHQMQFDGGRLSHWQAHFDTAAAVSAR